MKKLTITLIAMLLTALAWSQHTGQATEELADDLLDMQAPSVPFGEADNPLRMTSADISDFHLSERPAGIVIAWKSHEQDNFAGFQVLRSQDGNIWSQLYYLPAENLRSRLFAEYEFFDRHPFQGDNFYRLRKIYHDGTSAYSQSISVNYISNNADYQFKVYPNPAPRSSEVFVALETAEEPVLVDLIGSNGQVIAQYFISENRSSVSLGELPAGQYTISYRSKGELPVSKRLVVR